MNDNARLRSTIFKQLDGLVTAPVAYTLYKKGVLSYLLKNKEAYLGDLTKKFAANEGYLNVALRTLASQGFIDYHIQPATDRILLRINEKSAIAFSLFPLYKEVVDYLESTTELRPNLFAGNTFAGMRHLLERSRQQFGLALSEDPVHKELQHQILTHIEGVIVGQIAVQLGMKGMFHKYFMETSFRAEEFHKESENFEVVLDYLTSLGWFTKNKSHYQFTETGLFFAKRSSAYGVTVSYLPTFRKLDQLLFGDATLFSVGPGEEERHVDREMNVWGSGGSHEIYFKVIDQIIIELFNLPIEEQPMGILDMGCGNGAFLEHLFRVIDTQTLRGKMLEAHPLFLVGVDYNQAALKVTRANLINADIWAKVIWGDIGRPDLLARDLWEQYGIDLKELLNVRTFLDHNRIWKMPEKRDAFRLSSSSGAFAYKGQRLSNRLVEDNLLEHLLNWAPYIKRFGLLSVELHTIAPDLCAKNLGKTAATAYDATHGFSDQFIVELEVFHKIAAEAQLGVDPMYFKKFHDSEIATVSINLLKGI